MKTHDFSKRVQGAILKPAKFSRMRPDGSFCVEIRFRVDTKERDAVATRMTSWVEQWVQANRYWDWLGQKLDFYDDFSGPPTCRASGIGLVCLCLELRPGARKVWKDWLAIRLGKELQAAFKEIALDKGTLRR